MEEFIFERNKAYFGDALKLMPLMPNGVFDMVLADLPYGTTACKWDSILPFGELWEQYERLTKPGAAIVLTASQPFTSALVMSNPKMFKCEWIWKKNNGSNFANVKYQPMKEHESILVFGRGTVNYYPIMQERSEGGKSRVKYVRNVSNTGKKEAYRGLLEKTPRKTDGLRVPSSVQMFNKEVGLHPTQKPVPLFEYLIKTYTKEGALVLDNCAGSGTTAIACLNTNRDYVLIEKEEAYYNTINERISKHILQDLF